MKQTTTSELLRMSALERKELMKEPFELGDKIAGRNGEFISKGVYLPLSEYEKLNRAANYYLSFSDGLSKAIHKGGFTPQSISDCAKDIWQLEKEGKAEIIKDGDTLRVKLKGAELKGELK